MKGCRDSRRPWRVWNEELQSRTDLIAYTMKWRRRGGGGEEGEREEVEKEGAISLGMQWLHTSGARVCHVFTQALPLLYFSKFGH
jgi:hypothetical protein